MSENEKESYNNKDNNIDENKKILNISLIGNSATGKTSIINTYDNENFEQNIISTIGIDSKNISLKLSNGEEVILKIFDTAGQERYRSICLNILRNNKGVILVYSITDRKSFDDIANYWISAINDYIDKDSVIYLVGNKSDLKNEREVNLEEGNKLAQNYNFKFMETSAKNNKNIQELFKGIGEDVYNKFYSQNNLDIKNDNNNNKIELNNKKVKNKKHKCCSKK